MRLWIGARIPFTPISVGTSVGGRTAPGTGMGCLVLFGILLLVPICEGLASMPWWGWIVFPAAVLLPVAVIWWPRSSSKPPNQAKISDRR